MVESTDDPIEALKLAIKREEAAYQFYKKHAEVFKNQATRQMFERLADEEIKHKERLQRELDDHYYTEM
ncbi:MAG: ferritin family protein [Candidatus Zixiibacteriota bacterium]